MQNARLITQGLMLQALDRNSPCSLVLSPFADAVFELMGQFKSADVVIGDR